jgi:predicted nucleic acid-binding protein
VAVVDASVWVANYHVADPAHTQCADWLRAAIASGERLVAPSLVLAEVAAAIARLTGSPRTATQAIEHLSRLPGFELFDLDGPRARRAAEVAAATRVRGADAVYLALAIEHGAVLISLDRVQRERGGAMAEVRLP